MYISKYTFYTFVFLILSIFKHKITHSEVFVQNVRNRIKLVIGIIRKVVMRRQCDLSDRRVYLMPLNIKEILQFVQLQVDYRLVQKMTFVTPKPIIFFSLRI